MLTAALEEGRLSQMLPGAASHPSVLAGDRVLRVIWVNEERESGLPYDLVLAAMAPAGREAGSGGRGRGGSGHDVIAYVEVKSSRGHSRDMFEISQAELAFADREGKRYHILRVWGTRTGSAVTAPPRVQAFTDPIRLWQEKRVAVCLLV